MEDVQAESLPRPQRQSWTTMVRQNSAKAGILAENVVLPVSKRSGSINERAENPERSVVVIDLEAQAPTPKKVKTPTYVEQLPKQFPYFMIGISVLQALIFYGGGDAAFLLFAYDPFRRHEIWRLVTVMLVHASGMHLWGNVFFQLVLGVLLEIVHHWKRIGIIYLAGVIGGSLAVSVLDPDSYGLGASAGVYALLTAHVATIIVNWSEMDRKCCRVFWLLAYICFDVGVTVLGEVNPGKESNTSHSGHFGGALTGFLVAVFVLRNFEKHPWEKKFQKICAGIMIGLVSFAILFNIGLTLTNYYFPTEYNTDYYKTFLRLLFEEIAKDPKKHAETIAECQKEPECKMLLEIYQYNGTITVGKL